MAYSAQDDEEQQGQGLNQTLNQQGQPQPQAPEEPQMSAPSSQAPTIGSSQPAAPQQPKQQKAGTGTFTNLRNYLQANQGNRIASSAGQRVQNIATGAQKGIQQANTAFGQRVEQGTLADRQKAVQDVTSIAQAGRQVQYQAPQTPAPTQAVPTPAPAAPQSYFEADQEKRFADVINAQYKGPQSLQQAGLYDTTAKKVATASQAAKNTQTALGREQLLRDMFSKNRDYSVGQSRLDSLLLNTSAPGVQQLQTAAKPASEVQGQLEQAQTSSSNLAANRAREIQGIQEQARQAFTGQQTEQAQSVEDRVTAMTTQPVIGADGKPVMKTDGTPMTEWDRLPEYFKGVLANSKKQAQADNAALIKSESARRNKNSRLSGFGRQEIAYDVNNLNKRASLSPEEAAILGIQSGESLFNQGGNLIQTAAADREKLVSKDEVARQNALARLAAMDTTGALNAAQKYGIDKAGTQNALSALDTQKLRNILNEQKSLFDQQMKGSQWSANVGSNPTGAQVLGWSGYKTGATDYKAADPQTLTNIAEGAEYAPGATQLATTAGERYQPRAADGSWKGLMAHGPSGAYGFNQMLDKKGFTNKAQITENEASKTRAAALRALLASRDKTNV